jgi:hypothetical protein
MSMYEARWLSKDRLIALRKAGRLDGAIVLDSMKGFLIVEKRGSHLGDGPVLSREEADYELQPVWCTSATARIEQARRLIGLDAPTLAGVA